MKISVLCPTRGRPQSAARLLDSIGETAIGNVAVRFYCDEDDPKLEEYKKLNIPHATGPDFLFAMKCHLLTRNADGDILMMVGDDAVFRTVGWDNAIRSCQKKWPDGIWCASCWDGTLGKDLGDGRVKITHPHLAIGRRGFEILGYVTNPMFLHFCTDPWLTEVYSGAGRFEYFKDVRIDHLRCGLVINVEPDDTFERLRPGGRSVYSARDRTVYELFKRYRKLDTEILKRAIKSV